MNTASRRKYGLVIVVVLVVLLWLAVMIWLTFQPERTEGSLGIDDKTTHGAAGITSVLEDQGIAVRPAQSMSQLRAELDRHPDATVVFHDKNSAMHTASYTRLDELAGLVPPDQRVFAGVSEPQLGHLVEGVEDITGVPAVEHTDAEDSCQLQAAEEAGDIASVRSGVALDNNAQGCFIVDADGAQSYAYAQTADGSIIFADWQMLSNAGLYDNGTATLATWALGRADTVIWFQPDFSLDPDRDGELSPVQLPDWVRMSIVWAVIVTGIALFYIGRRSGPVITEPLPAEVSAAETTVGRGRMYAKAQHYTHAVSILQHASLARLARLLQLGNETRQQAILAEASKQLHRPVSELQQLYTPPAQRLTAQQFVIWAQQLQHLEQQVRERFSAQTKES